MVKFCPNCSNLLRKKESDGKHVLACGCGYEEELEDQLEEMEKIIEMKKKALEQSLIVVTEDDKVTVNPTIVKTCPKCSHEEAEYWQEQTRSADEGSTSFFRCLKCRFTFREY